MYVKLAFNYIILTHCEVTSPSENTLLLAVIVSYVFILYNALSSIIKD